MAHNYYSLRGGEDSCFERESGLLASRGVNVVTYAVRSGDVAPRQRLGVALRAVWSRPDYDALKEMIRRERPDVTHVHNSFPLMSPSVYHASQTMGVPVVQTLHNYRLLCPSALLLRGGAPCELCVGKRFAWPGVSFGCYSKGRAATAVVATMLAVHRARGTFAREVDVYIALTEFMRCKFIEGGLPPEKVVVKPIFIEPDPGTGDGSGEYALFVGRLSPEKGLGVLLDAWEVAGRILPLKIVGEGPLEAEVRARSERTAGVEYRGHVSRSDLLGLLKHARMLIFPSIWYEGSPAVIGEALAVGLPIIASNLGSMSSLIEHGVTGLHFAPGDAQDLASKVRWACDHPTDLGRMRVGARSVFEECLTADKSFDRQMEIYSMAIARRTVSASLSVATGASAGR